MFAIAAAILAALTAVVFGTRAPGLAEQQAAATRSLIPHMVATLFGHGGYRRCASLFVCSPRASDGPRRPCSSWASPASCGRRGGAWTGSPRPAGPRSCLSSPSAPCCPSPPAVAPAVRDPEPVLGPAGRDGGARRLPARHPAAVPVPFRVVVPPRPVAAAHMTGWRLAGVALAGALAAYAIVARWATARPPACCAEPCRTPTAPPARGLPVNRAFVCRAARGADAQVPATLVHEVYAAYGIPRRARAAHPLDDLIPAELGGDRSRAHNLWPQSSSATPGPRDKARLERRLRALVCRGRLTLVAGSRTPWPRTGSRRGAVSARPGAADTSRPQPGPSAPVRQAGPGRAGPAYAPGSARARSDPRALARSAGTRPWTEPGSWTGRAARCCPGGEASSRSTSLTALPRDRSFWLPGR